MYDFLPVTLPTVKDAKAQLSVSRCAAASTSNLNSPEIFIAMRCVVGASVQNLAVPDLGVSNKAGRCALRTRRL